MTPTNRYKPRTCLLSGLLYLLVTALFLVLSSLSSEATDGKREEGKTWLPRVWQDFKTYGPTTTRLPDFSMAGYHSGEPVLYREKTVFDVTDPRFGATPDDRTDDTLAIQLAVDAAGENGGGVVFLPVGQYDLKMSGNLLPIKIERNGIIIRGEKKGERITTLHLHNPGPDRPVRRLGTVAATEAARSGGAAIAVMGGEQRTLLSEYTADAFRGDRIIKVADTSLLQDGQMVVIECSDPDVNSNHPEPAASDLVRQLTHPFLLTEDQVDTFGETGKKVTWLVRVDKVLDSTHIRLRKPLRFDQLLRYRPRIFSFSGIREIGLETINISSSWPGGYRHHKPFVNTQGAVVRSSREQDYLWNGVWFSNAVDSWVHDVTFTDVTQGVILCYCVDMTIGSVRFHGQEGHAGITIGRSNGVLVKDADFFAPLVHPVTLTMMSSGNVVTDARTHYTGRNDHSGTDTVLDFHGIFPFENLFDNLYGFYICPGGDMSVLPHAGVRNVFWNIIAPERMSCYTGDADDEFMRTYAYIGTSGGTRTTMFEHLPQAFYIGMRREKNLPLKVGGNDKDRSNDWLTVEGLNRSGLELPSLYEAQRQE